MYIEGIVRAYNLASDEQIMPEQIRKYGATKLPCPMCREQNKDSKGDNLVITPEKQMAKCFSCGQILYPVYNEEYHESITRIKKDDGAKSYLEHRQLYNAAVRSRQIGLSKDKRNLEFWTDSEIVKIRPLSKKPKALSPKGKAPAPFILRRTQEPYWIITEGEMDALAAFALLENDCNYLSTSGANNTQLPNLAGEIIAVPDNDKAGEEWLAGIARNITVRKVAIPEHKDLNDWLIAGLTKEQFLDAIHKAPKLLRDISVVQLEIDRIYENKKVHARQRRKHIAQIIFRELLDRGEFLNLWGTTYFLDRESHFIFPINAGERWNALVGQFGLYKGEETFGMAGEYIQSELIHKDMRRITDAKVGSCYKDMAVYVDLRDGRVMKITANHRKTIRNADEVLFYRGAKEYPLEIDEKVEEDYLWELLEMFTIQDQAAKKLLYCWIMGVIFNGYFETKPLLFLQSVAGSGKTTLAKLIGQIIVGRDFNVSAMPENVDSFMAVLHKNAYLVFDNAERIDAGMFDHIAIAATGATFQKRKLYSEFDTVSAKANAWLIFTMITNSLKRKDLVERALLVELQRIAEFRSIRELREQFSPSKVWGSMINIAQKILGAMRDGEKPKGVVRKIRMADFAVFVNLVCKVKGWDAQSIATWWLKETAQEALEGSIYATAFDYVLEQMELNMRMRADSTEIFKIMHSKFNNEESISFREKEILKAWKAASFWGWVENQRSNYEMRGTVYEIKKVGHKKFLVLLKYIKEAQDGIIKSEEF